MPSLAKFWTSSLVGSALYRSFQSLLTRMKSSNPTAKWSSRDSYLPFGNDSLEVSASRNSDLPQVRNGIYKKTTVEVNRMQHIWIVTTRIAAFRLEPDEVTGLQQELFVSEYLDRAHRADIVMYAEIVATTFEHSIHYWLDLLQVTVLVLNVGTAWESPQRRRPLNSSSYSMQSALRYIFGIPSKSSWRPRVPVKRHNYLVNKPRRP